MFRLFVDSDLFIRFRRQFDEFEGEIKPLPGSSRSFGGSEEVKP